MELEFKSQEEFENFLRHIQEEQRKIITENPDFIKKLQREKDKKFWDDLKKNIMYFGMTIIAIETLRFTLSFFRENEK
jgi:hypothetical protein